MKLASSIQDLEYKYIFLLYFISSYAVVCSNKNIELFIHSKQYFIALYSKINNTIRIRKI